MEERSLVKIVSSGQEIELPSSIDIRLTPFSENPKEIQKWYGLNKLLGEIFDKESQRLNLSPERYEYSSINQMYAPEHPIFETHYLILDPGNPIMRGILGNRLGPELKEKFGVDISSQFELTRFNFDEVMFRLPSVDVGGYGNFHSFLNRINPSLREYNLIVAYLRNEGVLSFRHGFDDYVGLIKGIPVSGKGNVNVGEVDLEPINEIEEGKLYGVDVRGGVLLMAPIASCNWDLTRIEDLTKEQIGKLQLQDIPVKDRDVDTFHFLNGVTPHYIRQQLLDCFGRLS